MKKLAGYLEKDKRPKILYSISMFYQPSKQIQNGDPDCLLVKVKIR